MSPAVVIPVVLVAGILIGLSWAWLIVGDRVGRYEVGEGDRPSGWVHDGTLHVAHRGQPTTAEQVGRTVNLRCAGPPPKKTTLRWRHGDGDTTLTVEVDP